MDSCACQADMYSKRFCSLRGFCPLRAKKELPKTPRPGYENGQVIPAHHHGDRPIGLPRLPKGKQPHIAQIRCQHNSMRDLGSPNLANERNC